jgi:hypothetical protein
MATIAFRPAADLTFWARKAYVHARALKA